MLLRRDANGNEIGGVEEYWEYQTDETEVMEYTSELRNLITNTDIYREIFRCFVDKRMYDLATIMTNMYKQMLKSNKAVKEKDSEIQYLRKQLEQRDKQIADLQQLLQLNSSHGKTSSVDMMQMKVLYEQNYSLRKLGEMFNCDKNTVKQRLLEMGVELRGNNGR